MNKLYIEKYIDYFNNFLTVEGYADYCHISVEKAKDMLDKGRNLYHATLPKRVASIQVGRKHIYIAFAGHLRKNTVKLSECEIITKEVYIKLTS